jgi:PPP family 3-phenylpropionic acid transporter
VVLIRVAIIALAGSLAFMTVAHSYMAVFAAWTLYSFFGNPNLPLIDSVAVVEARRTGWDYARFRLWGSISFILSLAGFSAYLTYGGSIAHVPHAALIVIGAAVLSAFWLRDPDGGVVRNPPSWRDARKLFGNAPLQLFFLANLFHQAAISPYYIFYGIHLERLKLNELYLFGSVACGVLAEIGMFWFIGHILKRRPLFPLMGLSFLISVARWWLTAELSSGPALMAVQTLHAFTFALCYAGSVAHIDKAVAPELRGTGRALYSGISQGIGAICGHLLAGRIVEAYGTEMAYKAGAALEFIALGPLILSAWLEGKQALKETL